MRLAIFSDLHLNRNQWTPPRTLEADLFIVPGDINDGLGGIRQTVALLGHPIVAVLGNHDCVGLDIDEAEGLFRTEAEETGSTLLARDVVILEDGKGPVRLIGCTLWTDFACMEPDGVAAGEVMALVKDWSSDYTDITRDGKPLAPVDFVSLFERDRTWLQHILAQPFDGRTIVVTHHGPSRRSVHPKYENSRYVPYYVADLEDMIRAYQPDLWIHGHTHMTVDYRIGETRVFANQLGTEFEPGSSDPVNPFQDNCVIDI
ncbi:metallophosphoesterase [Aestuariispira ectoiniformans]|uniref:metallophosphoesterase n=1 Tax=Aestuariispira ectoiniformans TaxID=2775080 RepID=UPI00223A7B8F|nr:metallophosphoesterase [Aestuariispira ectoiniformans]